jgi:hypothetical protein
MSQETHYISITKINQFLVFWKKMLSIVRNMQNTLIHSVDRMQSFRVIVQMLHLASYRQRSMSIFIVHIQIQ